MEEEKKSHHISSHTKDIILSELSCLSLFQFLEEKVCQLFSRNMTTVERDLPYDIIINILSRLPAECVVRCRDACNSLSVLMGTPSFVEMHFRRATPTIALWYFNAKNPHEDAEFAIINEEANKFKTRTFSSSNHLYCSYNGFMVFNLRPDYKPNRYLIWNLITGQYLDQCIPKIESDVCGFFVHPPTKEYRILFVRRSSFGAHFENFIYGLMSENTRKLADTRSCPNYKKPPIIVNGCLYWMVHDENYKDVHGVKPECSASIWSFNIISETFVAINHPEQCGLRKKHDQMELMDMEGHLSFCDARSKTMLDIWISEENDTEWVKIYIVQIKPLLTFCGIQSKIGVHVNVGNFYMYKKELLLRVSDNDLILYNLQTGTMRRVGKRMRKELSVVAVPHIDSMFLDIF